MTRVGRVGFGGIDKEVNLDFLPEAQIGDFVLVHVGFALTVIEEDEGLQAFEALQKLADLLARNPIAAMIQHEPGMPDRRKGGIRFRFPALHPGSCMLARRNSGAFTMQLAGI